MLKFKVDENLPAEAALLFSDAGHDCCTVADQKLSGASDETVAQVCQDEQRALVTLDLDFADIRAFPPNDYAGLLVLRLKRLDKHSVLRSIGQVLTLLAVEPLMGKLWIVDESSARIHE
jgi:predicted nuclease of predicted toxin-antitoxin system